MRSVVSALGALSAMALLGCAEDADVTESSTFEPAPAEETGVTYDEDAVPAGAEFTVTSTTTNEDGTEVTLEVDGLEAEREFGAHVHTDPCGDAPEDSGPHYQDEEDPDVAESEDSTDPDYANPENEVWLDFTTDDTGAASAEHTVDWQPREGEANSIVLHEEHTATEEDEAGTAGDRLACITVEL